MSDAARKYATIKHPTIEALVGNHYRYKDHAQALARLTSIAKNFVLSKEQPAASKTDPVVILWIKGYALDEAEITQGFTGHFAEMRIVKRKDGLFTLTASKLEKPLSVHPQKKRPTAKHPNWGHPVMRSVKRGKNYATIEAAQAELELLHLEFPEVSIPGGAKLYIIIYEKREGIARPTHKIALEITPQQGGGFIILCHDNEKTGKAATAAPAKKSSPAAFEATTTPEFSSPGHFASVEEVRKLNRRRAPTTAANVEVKETDAGKFSATEKERKKRKKKKKLPRVSAAAPVDETEAQARARFAAAELEREARRRRRTTIFDVNRKAKRDEPK